MSKAKPRVYYRINRGRLKLIILVTKKAIRVQNNTKELPEFRCPWCDGRFIVKRYKRTKIIHNIICEGCGEDIFGSLVEK
jgi:hypothetical protein